MTSYVEERINIDIIPVRKDVRTTMEVFLIRCYRFWEEERELTGMIISQESWLGEPRVKEEWNFLPGATEKLKLSTWVPGSSWTKMGWGDSWGDGSRTCLGSEEGHSLAEASSSAVQLYLYGFLVTWLESRLRPDRERFWVLGYGIRTLLGGGNPF